MPPAERLPRSHPEGLGIPSRALLDLVDAFDAHEDVHSVMVVRKGTVVAEGWWDPYGPERPHAMFSLSKTFTAIAVGLVRADGLLSLDDPVLGFFPEEAPADPSDNLAAMRVRDLLTMRAGHHDNPSEASFRGPNFVRSFFELPVEHAPGTHFACSTAATYMLSAIVQRVTGERLLDYLKPRVLGPLGIVGATWEQCPQGVNMGGYGLAVRTEDIAALGVLLAQDGVYDDERLLPVGWVAEASAAAGPPVGADARGPARAGRQDGLGRLGRLAQMRGPGRLGGVGGLRSPNAWGRPQPDWEQGYGYHLWRCRHGSFRADGAFGQLCVVVPEHDLVVVTTAGTSDTQALLDAVWALLPALSHRPLPADPDAEWELTERLARLRLASPGVLV